MSSQSAASSEEVLARKAAAVAAEKVPAWAEPFVAKLAPVLHLGARGIGYIAPKIATASEVGQAKWKELEPYEPYEMCLMGLGICLMMYGGSFPTLIAAIEAFKMTGWDQVKEGTAIIYEDTVRVVEANAKDNDLDEDGDGVKDVLQISQDQLVARKAKVFIGAIRPVKLKTAITGLYAGLVGMLATLKSEFCRTITLGSTIGDSLYNHVEPRINPLLSKVISPQYQKWIPLVLRYFLKTLGVSVAWFLQRFLSAFHSSVRGAFLFTQAFARWTQKRGCAQISEGYADEIVAGLLCIVGLYSQLNNWFSLPFLLQLVFFPAVAAEYLLVWAVSFA